MMSKRKGPSTRISTSGNSVAFRFLALLLAASLLLPLVLPAMGGSTPLPTLDGEESRESGTGTDWPPSAWNEGDIVNLTLHDMVLLLGGVAPGDPREAEVVEQLERLEHLPPVYKEVATVTLEGMTQALWHQWVALTALPADHQASILAAVHGHEEAEGLDEALAGLNMVELTKAAAALMETAGRIERILEDLPRDPLNPGLADELAQQFGLEKPADPLEELLGTLEPLEVLAARLAGIPLGSPAAAELEAGLAQAPPAGAEAIHRILGGLDLVARADEADREQALVALARVVDGDYETLRLWSAMATARAHHERSTELPEIRFPDPNAATPPLRIGLPGDRWDQPLRLDHLTTDLGEALSGLARTLGDQATAAQASELVEPLQAGMTGEEEAALSRVLSATDAYLQTQRLAAATPLPQPLREDPGLLARWSQDLEEGTLPEPGTAEAKALLEVLPWLEIQRMAQQSLEEMLAAAEEIVPTFTMSTASAPMQQEDYPLAEVLEEVSGHLDEACSEAPDAVQETCEETPDPVEEFQQACTQLPNQDAREECRQAPHIRERACEEDPGLEKFLLQPYLALDLCGTDTVWEENEQAIVTIDVAGDDTYLHRAGAPFIHEDVAVEVDDVGSQTILSGNVSIPVSLLFDLDGNDTYDADGQDCAQGAACSNLFGETSNPVSVLVDWSGGQVEQANTFNAGNRSQGYGGVDGGLSAYGILIERMGESSSLDSTYVALNRSQGAADGSSDWGYVSGVLVRVVGDFSTSTADFHAANFSQGAADRLQDHTLLTYNRPPVGLFLSILGADTVADHAYLADTVAQGAVPSGSDAQQISQSGDIWDVPAFAVFASLGGPGTVSHDTYHANDKARGWAPSTVGIWGPQIVNNQREVYAEAPTAFFIDALAAQRIDADKAATLDDYVLVVQPAHRGNKSGTYSFLPEGHGWGQGRFVDIGGRDVYHREPDGSSSSSSSGAGIHGSLEIVNPSIDSPVPSVSNPQMPTSEPVPVDLTYSDGPVPRNNAVWIQPAGDGETHDFSNAAMDFLVVTNLEWTGMDLDHMDQDGDIVPTLLERAWDDWIRLWEADEEDAGRSPVPVTPCAVVDLNATSLNLDTPCGFVLSTGGQDRFWPDFTAPVVLNLGGNDRYEGRVGAAVGTPSGIQMGVPVSSTAPSSGPAPPVGIGFLLDVRGNDEYESPWSRTQGYGEGGAVGILFDLGGNDRFMATDHAQGVGSDRGMGVIATMKTPGMNVPAERNVFIADSPAQGHGVDGGIGVLVSTAGENLMSGSGGEFDESVTVEEDEGNQPTGGAGVSVADRVTNEPPVVVLDEVESLPLDPGVAYTFRATAMTGEEGGPFPDPLRFCWSIEHSGGTHEECGPWTDNAEHSVEYTWTNVRSTPHDLEQVFQVQVVASDPAGVSGSASMDVNMTEPPIETTDGLRGPRAVPTGTAAYQVPFNVSHEDRIREVRVDWGDGRVDTIPWDEDARQTVNWASAERNATVSLPKRVAVDGEELAVCVRGAGDLNHMINGETDTGVGFSYGIDRDSADCPPIQAMVEFPGLRQVSRVEVTASVEAHHADVWLLVEGLKPDGSTRILGSMEVKLDKPNEGKQATGTFDADLDDLAGIVVRQMLTENRLPELIEHVSLDDIVALGPGVESTWPLNGRYDVTYNYISKLGGASGDTDSIQVGDDTLELLKEHLTIDFASRGDVRNASVADGTRYHLDLLGREEIEGILGASGIELCIDWGDGTQSCSGVDDADRFIHQWSEVSGPGGYDVTYMITLAGQGDGTRLTLPLLNVDVLPAYDLRIGDDNPIMWLDLDIEECPLKWFSGVAYHAIVNRCGDNRYTGQVAAPRPPVDVGLQPTLSGSLTAQMLRPGFLYDHSGNDAYLSTEGITQGFGFFGGVALLYDRSGDDVYVAPSHAQGSAWRHGIGILIDQEGDDAYNPVPASHPDVLSGLPSAESPWNDPPETLVGAPEGRRAALWVQQEDRALLTQGAASDGFALLVDGDGHNVFQSGNQSQGYATREHADWRRYAMADPECYFLPQFVLDPGNPQIPRPSFIDPGSSDGIPVSDDGINNLCRLGATEILATEGPVMAPRVHSDTASLSTFLTDDERLGPAMGTLLSVGGVSAYHGNDHVQGAAQPGGRGLLWDAGVSVATAGSGAQGYAEADRRIPVQEDVILMAGDNSAPGGVEDPLAGVDEEIAAGSAAGIVAQGPFSWRSVSMSQGEATQPDATDQEGDQDVGNQFVHQIDAGGGQEFRLPRVDRDEVHDPALAFALGLAPGSAECQVVQSCGDSYFQLQEANLGLPPPTLSWDNVPGADGVTTEQQVTVSALVDTALGASGDLEAALVVVPRGITWTGGEPVCGWPILGPPVFIPVDVSGDAVEAQLDLAATMPDGPVIPSGCLELLLVAREGFQGGAITAWGSLTGQVIALPAPQMTPVSDGPVLAAPGGEVNVSARIDQPLAAQVHATGGGPVDPVMEWAAAPGGASCGDGEAIPMAPMRGVALDSIVSTFNVTWEVPDEQEAAEYVVCARAKWPGAGWSSWVELSRVFVDPFPPTVVMPGIQPWGDPRIRPLEVSGNITAGISGLGEGAIEVRLQDGWSDATVDVEVPPGTTEDSRERDWTAQLPIDLASFPGGQLNVEVNATSGAGVSTGWVEHTVVFFDQEPPRVVDAWTFPTGTNATRMEQNPVVVTVRMKDPAMEGCEIGTPGCPVGAGVEPQSVTGILHSADGLPEVMGLAKDVEQDVLDADGPRCSSMHVDCVRLEWHWDSGDLETIPEGTHRLVVHAADRAGNIGSRNPGLEFVIDRTLPRVTFTDSSIELPGEQTAVKPEDEFKVLFSALDPAPMGGAVPSGLYQFHVRVGNDVTVFPDPADPSDELEHYRVSGNAFRLPVPVGDHDPGEAMVPFELSVLDRALNTVQSQAMIDYRGTEPLFDGPVDVTQRADELWFEWASDRPVEQVNASLWVGEDTEEPDLETLVEGNVIRDGLTYRARFTDLQPGTTYVFSPGMVDEADWRVWSNLTTSTLPILEGAVTLTDAPTTTRSGIVDVDGTIAITFAGTTDEIPVTISLHVDAVDLENPIAASSSLLTPGSPTDSFAFGWDSRDWPSGDHRLIVLMDDGITFRTDTWDIRTDNEPPVVRFDMTGPKPRNGWHNGTVHLDIVAEDDTDPITVFAWVDGEERNATGTLSFPVGGVYEVEVLVRDAAVPPNEQTDVLTLQVDRTPPELDVVIDLPHPAVSERIVPLRIEAQDGLSGVDAFRVGTNTSSSSWVDEPPQNVTLAEGPDGSRWIHVDVRDQAGNVRHKSLPVTLDRLPPELVMAWWAGRSPEGTPMLTYVARDTMDGPGRPSGVAEIRFASPDAPQTWSPWIAANETATVAVPDGFWTEAGTRIQLRDRANNQADSVESPPLPSPGQQAPVKPSDAPKREGPPPSDLLRVTEDGPRIAHAGQRLSFVVYVQPWEGEWPDAVWLVIDDHKVPMVRDEEMQEDGSWGYRAEITAVVTRLGEPVPHYYFLADFGGVEVRTGTSTMPTTTLLESKEQTGDTQDRSRSVPAPGVVSLVLLLAVWSLLRVRGKGRRRSP